MSPGLDQVSQRSSGSNKLSSNHQQIQPSNYCSPIFMAMLCSVCSGNFPHLCTGIKVNSLFFHSNRNCPREQSSFAWSRCNSYTFYLKKWYFTQLQKCLTLLFTMIHMADLWILLNFFRQLIAWLVCKTLSEFLNYSQFWRSVPWSDFERLLQQSLWSLRLTIVLISWALGWTDAFTFAFWLIWLVPSPCSLSVF